MREDFIDYDEKSTDEEIAKYLIDEIKWRMDPTTGDWSNNVHHQKRLVYAAHLARQRGEYNALMGKPNVFLSNLSGMVALMGHYEQEKQRLAAIPWKNWKEHAQAMAAAIELHLRGHKNPSGAPELRKVMTAHAELSKRYVKQEWEKTPEEIEGEKTYAQWQRR